MKKKDYFINPVFSTFCLLGTRIYDKEKKKLINEKYSNDIYWYTPITNVTFNHTLPSGLTYKSLPSFKYTGINYKHRSSFIYNLSVQGAYWLTKQGAIEKGTDGLNKNSTIHESSQYINLSHNNECIFHSNITNNMEQKKSANSSALVDELFFDFKNTDELEYNYIININ